MELFLNVLLLNVWLPKGEKTKKVMGRKGVSLLNPLQLLQPEGEGGGNNNGCLPLLCTSVIRRSNQ